MEKLAQILGAMGDKALTAFIISQVLDTLMWMILLALCTWGIRSVWKMIKKHEWNEG